MLHRGPYTYSFTKKEEFFDYQEIKGGVKSGGGMGGGCVCGCGGGDPRPRNFVAFENASRVFRNGLGLAHWVFVEFFSNPLFFFWFGGREGV